MTTQPPMPPPPTEPVYYRDLRTGRVYVSSLPLKPPVRDLMQPITAAEYIRVRTGGTLEHK